MSRPQVEARIRAAQPAPVIRARPPVGDMVPPSQRAGAERTAVLPQSAPNRAPAIRQTGQFRPLGAPPAGKPPGVGPESVGAIALPRPPVQPGTSRAPVSQRTAPNPAPGTTRTAPPRKTGSLPPTPNHPSAPPPRSAEPPPLDDLVPRARSERPRHSRPPVSHRSQPPRDRPRFLDRSPEPRAPGGGLPGPDSFGRLPAPLAGGSQYPPASSNPEETMAMARSPYAAQPPPARQATGEYYPPPQPHGQTSRSYAPPPPADTYRDNRDTNEYYPHLHAQQQAPSPSAPYDPYPPPGYLPPRAAPGPHAMPMSSRAPMPSIAPALQVPPTEAPTFMGLVLFAAPLALATLAVAALALM